MKRYFVTGTDTGIGKTFVTTALARLGVSRGLRVFAWKPIETGCEGQGEDQKALVDAAGGWQHGDLAGLYSLREPAAPLVAAANERVSIDLDRVLALPPTVPADLQLLEGAGGWRVPITSEVDMGGLARRLGWPVIVVASARLGTLNHSLLTLEAVRRDGCELAALVLSVQPGDDPARAASNRALLAQRAGCPVLGVGPEELGTLL